MPALPARENLTWSATIVPRNPCLRNCRGFILAVGLMIGRAIVNVRMVVGHGKGVGGMEGKLLEIMGIWKQ